MTLTSTMLNMIEREITDIDCSLDNARLDIIQVLSQFWRPLGAQMLNYPLYTSGLSFSYRAIRSECTTMNVTFTGIVTNGGAQPFQE